MKKFLVIALLMCGMCAQALVIEGGVQYTVESARDEAFSKVQYTIPMIDHFEYLVDPGFSIGKDGKPKIRKFGRKVTFFSDGGYAVECFKTKYVYYYNKEGFLVGVTYELGYGFPRLVSKYDKNGILIRVVYKVAYNEHYVYDANKNYRGHWVGNNYYNKYGRLEGTRNF